MEKSSGHHETNEKIGKTHRLIPLRGVQLFPLSAPSPAMPIFLESAAEPQLGVVCEKVYVNMLTGEFYTWSCLNWNQTRNSKACLYIYIYHDHIRNFSQNKELTCDVFLISCDVAWHATSL